MAKALSLAVVLVLVAFIPKAYAEEREIALTMPHFGYDLGYVAVGGTLYLTARFAFSPRDVDRAPLDGRGHHVLQRPADVASDVLYFTVLFGGPLAGYLIDGARSDFVRALRVPIVLFESYIMTSAFNTAIKLSGVCRPYSWDGASAKCGDGTGVPSGADDQRASFPSGHTSGTASIGGALLGMWLLPRARDHRLAPLALGMTALSLTTGALRVRTGAHSLVDVSVGFTLGIGIGFATSALHLRTRSNVSVAPMGNGLSISGSF